VSDTSRTVDDGSGELRAYASAVDKPLTPPFAYHGGKSRLAPWIASLIPEHRIYVEPFAGSAAVLLAKPRAQWECINDLDGAVVAFWQALRDQPDELERVCALTPYARTELALSYEPTDDLLERARRFWIRSEQGIGRKTRVRTGWQVSTLDGRGAASQAMSTFRKLGRFRAVAERLAGVHIEHKDSIEIIGRIDDKRAVIYCDPPYVISARSSGGGAYTCEMTDDQHRALAACLRRCTGTVLLSGYASPLYDELYGDWWQTSTRGWANTANRHSAEAERTEVLWANRPLDEGRLDFAAVDNGTVTA